MIHKWFKHGVLTESEPVAETTDVLLDPNANGLIYIETKNLIALRHAAESLPLSTARVRSLQSGTYYSPFKGRGMEFDELRLYQAGDDVRTMDWRVTARTGKPHTKLFREERERTVFLWMDFRSSMFFGTQGQFKSVQAARAAALLAWSAAHQGDRLGGLLFNEGQHTEIRPQRGKLAVLHLLQKISQHSKRVQELREFVDFGDEQNSGTQGSSMQQSLARMRRLAKPGSLVFLIGDFRQLDQKSESHLYQLSRHNDVVMLLLYDPMETDLPPSGYYRVSDNINTMAIDTRSQSQRQAYKDRFQSNTQYLVHLCKRHRIHFMTLSTTDPVVDTLQREMGVKLHAS
ncbi:MAG: DUF58 domain-containing protein [Gammaproteobacteria bacterium]|nr:DUF58 domain-containing protein [Gammaproteobacteria bacterium]MDH5801710.1 DUF58 domain-containing protein [Gammaproteobacteria bacterium]